MVVMSRSRSRSFLATVVFVLHIWSCVNVCSSSFPSQSGDQGLTSRRRVNWFSSGGGWNVGTDGLNLSSWIHTHRNAITGTMPCCGCWSVHTNGTFYNTGRCASATGVNVQNSPEQAANFIAEWKTVKAAGLTIEPTGGFATDFLLNESWMLAGSLDSAMEMLAREGWDGLGIDNENYPPTMPPSLPMKFASLLGNLSHVATNANKSIVVDICSTWNGEIGGPQYLPTYANRTPSNVRYMDMAEYFAKTPNKAQIMHIKTLLPLRMIAPAIGLTEAQGHRNASCGGWPQCTNFSNPACGCLDYGWDQPTFAAFVADVEAAGMTEIDVWRQDMTPPPGTVPSIPPWLISELAGFLARGN